MKKITILFLFVLGFASAQETVKDSTKHWTRKGNFTLLANQSSFNNWQAGGQDNFAGNLGINYDFNYKNGNWNWDNKLLFAYGLTKIKDADTQKTDDRIEFNSLLGKKASGYWYYSAFFNFKTQMDTGFQKVKMTNDNGTPLIPGDDFEEDVNVRNSHFFSPAFFQFGPGMLWKKSDNLKVNIAPATSKLIVVHSHFTEFGSSFGVKQGETTRYEFGAAVNGYYKFNIMENVSFENILNLYSNYLEDPQNVDLDYQLNIVMKINKYLTTNFAFHALYDDNAFRGFQTKQIIGLGVNYNF